MSSKNYAAIKAKESIRTADEAAANSWCDSWDRSGTYVCRM
ncbi:hypothetical protein SynRS9915_01210 [Synechococcus sp. RS9915]|nr:hypothetical protein SynRS9915_01210 [Synechococcus sp. RS9915]